MKRRKIGPYGWCGIELTMTGVPSSRVTRRVQLQSSHLLGWYGQIYGGTEAGVKLHPCLDGTEARGR